MQDNIVASIAGETMVAFLLAKFFADLDNPACLDFRMLAGTKI